MQAPPPYQHRRLPEYGQPKKSSRRCCCKCMCCCCCFLLIIIIILAALAIYFYTAYKPKVPSYNVKGMDVKSFVADEKDMSLNSDMIVHAEANNPNSHIRFEYGYNSAVVVLYKDTTLCSGKLPVFEQGTKNITVMDIEMKGKTDFNSELQDALEQNQKNGNIPLLVTVKAPIKVVVGSLKLRQVIVHVKCHLVIDSLSPGKKPNIVSSSYDVHASF